MHELSIAMSIVEGTSAEAARHRGVVRAVHLRLGPLSGVVAEALRFSWQMAVEGTAVDGAALVIEPMPLVAWCGPCGCERRIASPQRLACPVCGAATPEVRGGRELEVTALEIADDIDADDQSAAAGAQAQ
jgi:hydrogenase nickel incorporation protein HypA/HybF